MMSPCFPTDREEPLGLVDHDGFVIRRKTFNNTARAVMLNGVTTNGGIDNNISVAHTSGAGFPHYSGVSAGTRPRSPLARTRS